MQSNNLVPWIFRVVSNAKPIYVLMELTVPVHLIFHALLSSPVVVLINLGV